MDTSKTKIMIISGTGTLAENMIDQFNHNYDIYVISRDQNKQYILKTKYPKVNFLIGDMKNYETIKLHIDNINPNIVIINGAIKHIDMCENNIMECLQTNVYGVQNVIVAIKESNVTNLDTVIFISTDKSCNLISVYGFSKALSERILAQASIRCQKKIKYISIRLGNLFNSTGSLVSKFIDIGSSNTIKDFPVTNPHMTRFFVTLEQCTHLIQTVINYGQSGEIWVPIVPSYKILDIALFFSKKYNKPIKITGSKPGEKIHESLINEVEINQTEKKIFDGQEFYVIKSCQTNCQNGNLLQPYTSQNTNNTQSLESIISKLLPDLHTSSAQ